MHKKIGERYKGIIEDIVDSVEKTLKKEGYVHARIETPKDTDSRSIDILAWSPQDEKKKIHLKITLDTEAVNRQEIIDLLGVSRTTGSKPIVVSEYEKRIDLQDEVIYEKSNVPAVNVTTLKKLLDESRDLYIISRRGDFFIRVDGRLMRKLREEKGLSLGEIAEQLGVTRKAVYEYERNAFDVSINYADKLLDIYGEEITRPYKLFSESSCIKTKLDVPPDNKLEQRLIEILKNASIDHYHARKAFVDILATIGTKKLFMGVEHKKSGADVLDKAEELSKIKGLKDIIKIIIASKEKRKDIESISDEIIVVDENELRKILELLEDNRFASEE